MAALNIPVISILGIDGQYYDVPAFRGEKGDPGIQGPIGPIGPPGPKGEPGIGFQIYKIYKSVSEMNSNYSTSSEIPIGGFVLINTENVEEEDNAKLYMKTNTCFQFVIDMSGAKGIQGPQGEPGYSPKKGIDYFDGQEGPMGPQGPQGIPGEKGSVPQRGIDYFTDQDISSIVSSTVKLVSKDSIGLSKVDNTPDSEKSVNYATTAGQVSWNNITDKPTVYILDCGNSN